MRHWSPKRTAIIEAAAGVRIAVGGIATFVAADPSIVGDAMATTTGPTIVAPAWSWGLVTGIIITTITVVVGTRRQDNAT